MIVRLVCIVIGYLFGLFQTAYFYGRYKGIDIRKVGSGNAGTTNALRAFGTGAGVLVFAGDCLKCLLAVLVVRAVIGKMNPDLQYLAGIYAAFGCILGHNFPFFMNFKGGKGIACTAGLVLTYPLPMIIIELALFFGPAFLTHYVSLGSLLINIGLIVGTVILGSRGVLPIRTSSLPELYILIILIAALAFYQHRENIKRLIAGNERKTYLFKKK
ncbi:MAG: glycerol-3-phosphate 1-O-acyltransferase PlsY [Lachnospiraceae bacterium]|nr:glycerol-3-phosphate 1-O-acyltransferase PlsY [Lachnospiraceae bacterium]